MPVSKTTTWAVDLKKLADASELGSVMVRLMMALQDFALANHAMGAWKSEASPKLKNREIGAARYFLRLQIAHLREALKIVNEEIEKNDNLKAAVAACDAPTKRSYQTAVDFSRGGDNKLVERIRSNISFHYDPKVVKRSLQRLEARQNKKRKEGEYVNGNALLTLGHNAMDWYFTVTDAVEIDIVVHDIFDLNEDEQPEVLQEKVDAIMVRLYEAAAVFADFAGHFVKFHAKT
jgi:hypothetical protein